MTCKTIPSKVETTCSIRTRTPTITRTPSKTPTASKTSTSSKTPSATATSTNTATFTPTVTSTATPQCYGSGCHGFYASDKGCNSDAATYDFVPLYDANNVKIGEVRFRYSDVCFSQWAQVVSVTANSFYTEDSIRWGYIDYTSDWWPEDGQLSGINDTLYTLMYGVDGGVYPPALVCGSALVANPVYPPPLTPSIPLNSPYGLNNCIAR